MKKQSLFLLSLLLFLSAPLVAAPKPVSLTPQASCSTIIELVAIEADPIVLGPFSKIVFNPGANPGDQEVQATLGRQGQVVATYDASIGCWTFPGAPSGYCSVGLTVRPLQP